MKIVCHGEFISGGKFGTTYFSRFVLKFMAVLLHIVTFEYCGPARDISAILPSLLPSEISVVPEDNRISPNSKLENAELVGILCSGI